VASTDGKIAAPATDQPSKPNEQSAALKADVDGFLDQCRLVQTTAARLCKEGSGLNRQSREQLNKLRLALLETRQMLLPPTLSPDGSPATTPSSKPKP
jgi:hypothetical protein